MAFLTVLWWGVGGPLREQSAVSQRLLDRAMAVHGDTVRVIADYQERLIRAEEDLLQATQALSGRTAELGARTAEVNTQLTVFYDALDRKTLALNQARGELSTLLNRIEVVAGPQAAKAITPPPNGME